MRVTVRPGEPEDLDEILAIQGACAELSQWSPGALAEALTGEGGCRLLAADLGGRLAGFLLWRPVAGDETEILNLAVAESARRKGVAASLMQRLIALRPGEYFLEVRASNTAAQSLYEKLGFFRDGLRRAYYHRPVEDAVLMRRGEILRKDESG
jgi:ribosomal-protein-alanine N-acetyltransferase